MTKIVRIVIDDETHRQAKARAALAGATLAAWIAAAIEEKAQRPTSKRSTKEAK